MISTNILQVSADSAESSSRTVGHPSQVAQLLEIIIANSCPGLCIIHINIQSLPQHIDELRCDLQTKVPDIVLLSETWLKSWHSDGLVSVEGYRLLRNDRCDVKRAGGVGIFLKKTLKYKIISKSSYVDGLCEFIIIEVSISTSSFLIGCVYNPHKRHSIENFLEAMSSLSGKFAKIIVGGDFNYNSLDTSDDSVLRFASSVDGLGLCFVNNTLPTHFQGDPTLLDHFLVSNKDEVMQYQQLSAPGYSKHDLIFMVFSCSKSSNMECFFSFRDFHRINRQELSEDVSSIQWYSSLSLPINECVDFMEVNILKLFEDHVPITTKRVRDTSCQWMTTEIMQLRRKRDSAFKKWKHSRGHSSEMFYRDAFIRSRNLTNSRISSTKKEFYNSRLDPKLPTKQLWNNLRSIGVADKPEVECTIPPNDLISSFFPAPTLLNQQIGGIASRSASPFGFHRVTTSDVIFAVSSLKSNAIGLDGISLRFLKIILPHIIPFLTDVMNRCLVEGLFPSQWKCAKVIAVPKKSDGFRPISLLPCVSKVLEKIASIQITEHVQTNNLLSKFQSGFRKHHSCKTAVLKVADDIREIIDNNKLGIMVLIDFSKAFDTVDHDILLKKLSLRFGFNDNALHFVESYIRCRSSIIFSNHSQSNEIPISCGVPQGSILGPLFFCLYCEDMECQFEKLKPHFYADDTQLYMECERNNLTMAVNTINNELSKLAAWALFNRLGINARKSQCIIFSRKPLETDNIPQLVLAGDKLEYVSRINNLGILMNSQLTWDDQIKKICLSIFLGLRKLWCVANILPQSTKLELVKCLLGHNFISSDVVMGELNCRNFNSLQGAFNSMVRFVFNLRKYDHISHVSCEIFGLPLKEFLRYRRQIFLFKLIESKKPGYLYDKLEFFKSQRLRRCLHIVKHNYHLSETSFFIFDVDIWNHLTPDIRNNNSMESFKQELLDYMKRSV